MVKTIRGYIWKAHQSYARDAEINLYYTCSAEQYDAREESGVFTVKSITTRAGKSDLRTRLPRGRYEEKRYLNSTSQAIFKGTNREFKALVESVRMNGETALWCETKRVSGNGVLLNCDVLNCEKSWPHYCVQSITGLFRLMGAGVGGR